ncbi:hypothetical protein FDH86_gp008 [Arthrobacter phage Tank]|uniref:Uncharacterized protein n=1 Tax=Arthrobacter phage Tank TaxID=1772319 RepID=A0A0U4IPV4_9CAUD|nr:hypothetical protein FDH86_gp008 [Arthrobacter phage Tank]ALY10543.1 hypothetical protein TANK_8 [Arthrobacter phage Tank]
MVERTIVEWPNAGYELMVELTRQKCAEEERKRKWLERFATLALWYHKAPRGRWELGAIDRDSVSWRCPKPTAERFPPGTNGWLHAAAMKIRAGEWSGRDAVAAHEAGKWLCL